MRLVVHCGVLSEKRSNDTSHCNPSIRCWLFCGASVRDRSDIIIKILYAANCTASFSWRGVRATADADGQLRLQRTCVAAPVIYQLR